MTVAAVPMYRVVCDGNDCEASPQDGTDYFAWADRSQAEDESLVAGWIATPDGKHWCSKHVRFDGEADGGIGMLVPAPGGDGT